MLGRVGLRGVYIMHGEETRTTCFVHCCFDEPLRHNVLTQLRQTHLPVTSLNVYSSRTEYILHQTPDREKRYQTLADTNGAQDYPNLRGGRHCPSENTVGAPAGLSTLRHAFRARDAALSPLRVRKSLFSVSSFIDVRAKLHITILRLFFRPHSFERGVSMQTHTRPPRAASGTLRQQLSRH